MLVGNDVLHPIGNSREIVYQTDSTIEWVQALILVFYFVGVSLRLHDSREKKLRRLSHAYGPGG